MAAMADSSAGWTISLVEEGGAAVAAGATGIWQNLPVKFGGQRQRSVCRQTPPFLQSRGQRTGGGGGHRDRSAVNCSPALELKNILVFCLSQHSKSSAETQQMEMIGGHGGHMGHMGHMGLTEFF